MSQSAERNPLMSYVVVRLSQTLLQYTVNDWLMHSRQFHGFIWLTNYIKLETLPITGRLCLYADVVMGRQSYIVNHLRLTVFH